MATCIDLICTECGKPFVRRKTEIDAAVRKGTIRFFCSLKCQHLSLTKSVIIPCSNCGKPVTVSRANWNKTEKHFCSHSCAAISNNSGRVHSEESKAKTSARSGSSRTSSSWTAPRP